MITSVKYHDSKMRNIRKRVKTSSMTKKERAALVQYHLHQLTRLRDQELQLRRRVDMGRQELANRQANKLIGKKEKTCEKLAEAHKHQQKLEQQQIYEHAEKAYVSDLQRQAAVYEDYISALETRCRKCEATNKQIVEQLNVTKAEIENKTERCRRVEEHIAELENLSETVDHPHFVLESIVAVLCIYIYIFQPQNHTYSLAPNIYKNQHELL